MVAPCLMEHHLFFLWLAERDGHPALRRWGREQETVSIPGSTKEFIVSEDKSRMRPTRRERAEGFEGSPIGIDLKNGAFAI